MDRPLRTSHLSPAAAGGPPSAAQRIGLRLADWRWPSQLAITAWVIVLACSLLPTVIAQELFGETVTLGQRAAITASVIVAAFLATLARGQLRALRPLLAVLLTLVGSQWLVFGFLAQTDTIRDRTASPAFAVYMPTEVLLNLVVTAAVVVILTALHGDRRSFYLAIGQLAAPAGSVWWLPMRRGDGWTALGRNLTLAISLGTLAFLVVSGAPGAGLLGSALPILPAILFAAALNAFNEEVSYKASILSVLEAPLGRRDALRMVAAYFGIAHFYGVPYGLVGVALAWFLGWVLARSMAETRGMGWAWFIHFVQDVLIFTFMAGSAIVPGGG